MAAPRAGAASGACCGGGAGAGGASCCSLRADPDSPPPPLRRCTDAVLVFDNGDEPLPVNKHFLMIHSGVMFTALTAAPPARDGPSGPERIPVPGDTRAAWQLALQLLLPPPPAAGGAERAPQIGADSIEALLYLIDKWDLRALCGPATAFLTAPRCDCPQLKGARVWRLLTLAARCRLPAVVARCCAAVVAQRLPVPQDIDLGAAAQPLASYLSRCIAGAAARCTGCYSPVQVEFRDPSAPPPLGGGHAGQA
ncbi:hypothetical protein Rsub_02279 [Raphidocelis subcapitata]|uniref:BTB domain-containing protein n=1 Tax=Raphidocelis subcapitata TaxID=307507 RepID=A0A2V0NPK8_9CHLO|nr:hypothetical protein Rsub_02279 [Raphidocelis subcapitata]|eukprot:GBF89561.1 hypothetical protein Rsub_02279 [Raphidocelis subcapitata]